MKANWIIGFTVLLVLLPAAALGQSTFALRNRDRGVDAPVFDSQGNPLAGTGFMVELWGGAASDSLTPALTAFSNQRVIIPFMTDGYFSSGEGFLSVPDVPPGGWAWLQVRAWDASLGGTYEQVASLGLGGYGESPLFYAQGGTPLGLPGPPGPLVGLQSFSLRAVVPEPGSVLLLVLGLPLLLVCRRNQR